MQVYRSLFTQLNSPNISPGSTGGQPSQNFLAGPTAPQYWCEEGMIWPLPDLMYPAGSTDLNSLRAWTLKSGLGIRLLPQEAYRDCLVATPTKMPVACIQRLIGHDRRTGPEYAYGPPFFACISVNCLHLWQAGLKELLSLSYSLTGGPVIPASFLPSLTAKTPHGQSKVVVQYAAIAYANPPGDVLVNPVGTSLNKGFQGMLAG
jgi:hypothetical protein